MLSATFILGAAGLAGSEGPSQATIIGWVVLAALTLSGLAVNVLNLVRTNRTQKRDITITDQWVTHAACSASHLEIQRRLASTESHVTQIWETMRKEDEATRAEVRRCFQDIERALGRIEGQLKER